MFHRSAFFINVLNSLFSFTLLKIINQLIGRAVVVANLLLARQLWQDFLRNLFAVFHTPLVKGIDIPHDALHKNFVFIQGD